MSIFTAAERARRRAGYTSIPTPLYNAMVDAVERLEEETLTVAQRERLDLLRALAAATKRMAGVTGTCRLCDLPIRIGQMIRDGGAGTRAHETCFQDRSKPK